MTLVSAVLALWACSRIAPTGSAGAPTSRNPFQVVLARSNDLGPVQPGRRVSFLLTLYDPTEAQRDAYLAAVSDRRSPLFGRFKTARQYQSTFGPRPTAIGKVQVFLRRAGLAARWRPGNDWLTVSGPARRVEALFRVAIRDYVTPGGIPFYAGFRDPVVPAALQPTVTGAGHLSSYVRPRVRMVTHAIPAVGLSPNGLIRAYDMQRLRYALHLDGTGETVVLLEIDGYEQSDLDLFTKHFHLPPMHPRVVAGPPLSGAGGEATMDLEVVHAIAPGARLLVYNSSGSVSDSIDQEDRLVRDNPGAIVSNSIGLCDGLEGYDQSTAEGNAYATADQNRLSVYVASGDSGAYDCIADPDKPAGTPPGRDNLGVDVPSSTTHVTAVGGTRISVRKDGTWYSETAWEQPISTSGTGGGVSAFFKQPPWQYGPGVDNAQYNPHRMRMIPDVAAAADPESSATLIVGGDRQTEGGTSQAAPIWAGMTALIDEYLRRRGLQRIGFANPALYRIAARNTTYHAFHDITVGGNLYYPARPGYDLATGLGTPDAWNLAQALASDQRGRHR